MRTSADRDVTPTTRHSALRKIDVQGVVDDRVGRTRAARSAALHHPGAHEPASLAT